LISNEKTCLREKWAILEVWQGSLESDDKQNLGLTMAKKAMSVMQWQLKYIAPDNP